MEGDPRPNQPLGIDSESVTRWFGGHVGDAQPPLGFERAAGGHSNLTYIVTDAEDARFVLRRPPMGDLLSTAHDVTREHDIMAAVAAAGVPVPRMLGVCRDEAVTGAPFYVMEHLDGVVLHTAADAHALLPSTRARARAGETIVDALVALHGADIDDVGLGNLSRRDGFLARQLNRWSAQWDTSRLDDLRGMEELHRWLVERRPAESSPYVVHGDFRLGNALLDRSGTLLGVLDWELCTLGDPLADVAYLARSWSTPDARFGGDEVPSALDGFPSAEDLVARYAAGSGRALDELDYWMAFTAWRAAAILGGVYRRYLDGTMGTAPPDLELFRVEVEARMHQGMQIAHLL
jgi:aminoglycoside phosphotransferase (APT) family kinase protein